MKNVVLGLGLTLFLIGMLTLARASSGGNIDVYTQHGGQGPNEPSEAFTPQDEVILFALVMYNDWPEQNKKVTFGVYDPNGGGAIYIDTTDGDGVASTSFTIPAPGVDPFGTWEVTATVDVAGKSCKDTLKFEVSPNPKVIPEVPLGTIVGSAVMVIAVMAYVAVGKWRRDRSTCDFPTF